MVRLHEIEGLQRVHDLLGKVLAEGTFRLVRRGLDRNYQEAHEDLAGIRGKLAVGETAKGAALFRRRPKRSMGLLRAARQELLDPSEAG